MKSNYEIKFFKKEKKRLWWVGGLARLARQSSKRESGFINSNFPNTSSRAGWPVFNPARSGLARTCRVNLF